MAAKQKSTKPTGRPSLYTPELAEFICSEIIAGKSLVDICESAEMPHRITVITWMGKHESFATAMARAREEQGEYMDYLVKKTADECTPENAPAARVKIAAYQWRAGHLKPKTFGPKLDLDAHVTGDIHVVVGGDV